MRLLLDAHLSPAKIGDRLRALDHDVRALDAEPEFRALRDEDVLTLAVTEDRILITCNCRDFVPIARAWAEGGRTHAGIILVWSLSNREFAAIVDAVVARLAALPDPAAWSGLTLDI